jgi:hypothetical protein
MTDAPPAAPARNLLIDTLRAFALIGVYMVHMFEQYEIYWAAPKENLTHTIFTTFAMGKAFSLLTLCFGLSFFILMDRAAQRGTNFSGRFAWRMAVLALIGLAHSLVYRGDILMVLAPLGLLLIPFYRASGKIVLTVAAVLLAQPDPPTAIFASNDDMAAGVLAVAHDRGLAVPADLSVAGFDDTTLARTVWPPLTTIHQPMAELARTATAILIEGGEISHRRLPHTLVQRASVAPPARTPA